MSKYRQEVLSIFKQLHKLRKSLYQGDEPNLAKARAKINDEFKKHKLVQNEGEISELKAVAKEVEYFYRTRVIQAAPTEDGKHRIRITADTNLVDNCEYDPVRVAEHSKNRSTRPRSQCCQKKD